MSQQNSVASGGGRLVICVGDIHGFVSKLQNLWSILQSQTDPSQFNNALIIFLGDYCDRGPDTKRVIDFLISLPSKYQNQKHVFLAGNHDIAFAAFLGVLPRPLDGSEFKEGWREYAESEEREGWYKGEGYEDMYLQGRRWAGSIKVKFNTMKGTEYKGSIYDAGPTFESYGVPHGSAVTADGVGSLLECKAMEDLLLCHNGPGLQRNMILDAASELPMLRSISLDWCDAREGEFYLPDFADRYSLSNLKISRCKLRKCTLDIGNMKGRKRPVHKETLVLVWSSNSLQRTVVKERIT